MQRDRQRALHGRAQRRARRTPLVAAGLGRTPALRRRNADRARRPPHGGPQPRHRRHGHQPRLAADHVSRLHLNTWDRIRAVLTSPSLYDLAQEIAWEPPVGKPRNNPDYVVLAYGVLSRILRSGIRVELDLAE